MTTEFYTHHFASPGYMTAKVPADVMEPLSAEIKRIQDNNFAGCVDVDHTLAGHLAHQFDLIQCKDIVNNFVCYMANQYNRDFGYYSFLTNGAPPPQVEVKQLWANFQKKHDFNPVHDHSGVMSFVIWHTIPYAIEDEMQQYKHGGTSACASTFEFLYTDALGNIRNKVLPVHKEWEGVICMFPAKMRHLVNPFYTSDKYRISIAGNIDWV